MESPAQPRVLVRSASFETALARLLNQRAGVPRWSRVDSKPGRGRPHRDADEITVLATPWVTIVWNDPVNLMSYVTYVFSHYFGYEKKKAEKLMLEVHKDGRSVVSSGSREEMERDVQAMHEYGLWATMEKQ